MGQLGDWGKGASEFVIIRFCFVITDCNTRCKSNAYPFVSHFYSERSVNSENFVNIGLNPNSKKLR